MVVWNVLLSGMKGCGVRKIKVLCYGQVLSAFLFIGLEFLCGIKAAFESNNNLSF